MRDTSRAIIYSTQKDWRSAPEAIIAFIKVGFWCIIIGAIAVAVLTGNRMNDQKERQEKAASTSVCPR